ncbi:unnamed protein product [Linum trigynum]|uniref:RNase H type-1 domain-containing protein n=1 Tax=Linum trigynum TaxID=586398 RepID=A0AAV2FLL5_9ROSI
MQVPLVEMALQPVPSDMMLDSVADYLGEDGLWDVDRLASWLPAEVLQKMTAVAVDPLSTKKDRIFWTGSSNVRFSTKSAYLLANPPHHDPRHLMWKKIWRLPVPERVRCFAWLVCLGKIATNQLRFSRKCAPSSSCYPCEDAAETICHVLRDCPPAVFFWSRHVPAADQQAFFSASTGNWLQKNLLKEEVMVAEVSWNAFFSIAIWCLWKNRCTGCFKGVTATLSAPSLSHSIMHRVNLWHKAWSAPSIVPGKPRMIQEERVESIGWLAPPRGWMKLNVDGASAGNPGIAGAGGLIRDDQGRWIAGFVAKIGETSAALAELWAIRHGLDIAWRRRCTSLIVESDSQLAIQLIKDRQDPIHPYAGILMSIRRLLSQDWLVNIVHTYREGNRAADWLSKHSLVYPYGVRELFDPPRDLCRVLQEDNQGVSFERRIVVQRDR